MNLWLYQTERLWLMLLDVQKHTNRRNRCDTSHIEIANKALEEIKAELVKRGAWPSSNKR